MPDIRVNVDVKIDVAKIISASTQMVAVILIILL